MALVVSILAVVISLGALLVSVYSLYLTRFKKGTVRMTRPRFIYFGPDSVGREDKKVMLRTLLHSTSDQGNYVQSMYIRLQRGKSVQNFNLWFCNNGGGLEIGSGLFVDKKGIVCNHHFAMPKDGADYEFLAGEYLLQVYVELIGEGPHKVFEQKLSLTKTQEEEMKKIGIHFNWAPNTQNYASYVDAKEK